MPDPKTGHAVACILYEQIRLEMNEETKKMNSIFEQNQILFDFMHEKEFVWCPRNVDDEEIFRYQAYNMVKMNKSERGIFIEGFSSESPMSIIV